MSDDRRFKGILIKLSKGNENITLEEQARNILQNQKLKPGYENYVEEIKDCEIYAIVNDCIYYVCRKKLDASDDVYTACKVTDNGYAFDVKYYDGGCSFEDAIECAMQHEEVNTVNSIIDFMAVRDRLSKEVFNDTFKRIVDWLSDGGTEEDNYIQNQFDYINKILKRKKKQMEKENKIKEESKIVITIDGGLIQDVSCTDKNAKVIVVDLDSDVAKGDITKADIVEKEIGKEEYNSISFKSYIVNEDVHINDAKDGDLIL